MGQVFDIANAYVEAAAALDPFGATGWGIAGYDEHVTDFSPDGLESRDELDRRTIAQLTSTAPQGDHERLTRDFMLERLRSKRALFEAGEDYRPLNILGAPSVEARGVFDQMPHASREEWRTIAIRMAKLPQVMAGFRATLEEGQGRRGLSSARRQALECAKQAEVWSGQGKAGESFFRGLVQDYQETDDALKRELQAAADAAARAYADLATYLRDVYASKAPVEDGAGAERYLRCARSWLGQDIDLRETYDWGWQELHDIEADMAKTAARVKPGASVADVFELLKTDPQRRVDGIEAYREWLQQLHDQVIDDLDGVHFQVPEQVRRIEVMIPAPGGALAPHYTLPSEDFSRPGRTWWPTGSATSFAKWDKVTTAYHEGVPGHHFQIGVACTLGDKLSRFQRTMGFVSGHGEGWALYAERLMGELGYLENPDYYMGLLSAQAFRAVRVIIDIGLHLGLAIPAGEPFHPGETWRPEIAQEFLIQRSGLETELLESEIVRYLGLPGQAISYKVGEREWMRARERAKHAMGAAFDLKQFHTAALGLGPLPLEMLGSEIERALRPGGKG